MCRSYGSVQIKIIPANRISKEPCCHYYVKKELLQSHGAARGAEFLTTPIKDRERIEAIPSSATLIFY